MNISELRARTRSLTPLGIADDVIDVVAFELTSHLIEVDSDLDAAFNDAVESPVHLSTAPKVDHLIPSVSDFLGKNWGTGNRDEIRAIAEKCFLLSVALARGEA